MLSSLFKRSTADHTLDIQPAGLKLKSNTKSTILQAALDQAVAFPHNCRVGGCATCKCKLISGRVREMTDKSYVLNSDELKQGYILACQSVALTDVTIEVTIGEHAVHPIVHTAGEITRLTRLTHDIMNVEVKLDKPAMYTAGQYAEIFVPDVVKNGTRTARSYSVASAPGAATETDALSFFIRHVPGGEFTEWLFNKATVGTRLEGHGPYGDFWLRPGTAPLICIAGGSGLAPVLALLEQARIERITRDVVLFFGARAQRDLYCLQRIEELARTWMGRFEVVYVLSSEPENSGWEGRRGFVPEHMQAVVGHRAREHHAYLCGPPVMLDACIKWLEDAGVGPSNIHFDKFLDRSHVTEA